MNIKRWNLNLQWKIKISKQNGRIRNETEEQTLDNPNI